MESQDGKTGAAAKAEADDLWKLVRDHRPEVLSKAIYDRTFSEDMALYLARRRDTHSEVLALLAGDVRFRDSSKLKVAICKNPRTPQKVALSLLKFLRVFDLADVARDQQININIRRKIEYILAERMSSMPSGVKKALARKANSNILAILAESGDKGVISACLDSPFLTEGLLYKLLIKKSATPALVQMTAGHKKWSSRYFIRFGLIRSFHTPMTHVVPFIRAMKTNDLRDLYADPSLPSSTRPFIYRELGERGHAVRDAEDSIFALSGNEDSDMRLPEDGLN